MYEKEVVEIEHLIQKLDRWRNQWIDLIAELIKECIIERKPDKGGVNQFRSEYQEVNYGFDELGWKKPGLVEIKAT
jgi:hypothetical protein